MIWYRMTRHARQRNLSSISERVLYVLVKDDRLLTFGTYATIQLKTIALCIIFSYRVLIFLHLLQLVG